MSQAEILLTSKGREVATAIAVLDAARLEQFTLTQQIMAEIFPGGNVQVDMLPDGAVNITVFKPEYADLRK
jgi:hypothetical protein